MMKRLRREDTVLFQGDSITDTGRIRENEKNMGSGYAMLISAYCGSQYFEESPSFVNRGIGMSRVTDLYARLESDFLAVRPSWVSILIGINECLRRYDSNDPVSAQAFEKTYGTLLSALKQQLNARLVLCEPFSISIRPEQDQWREDLDEKIEVVRKLAKEYDAFLVPLDRVFAQAVKRCPPEFWTFDGVHPTPAGHGLIARTWLETVEG